MRHKHLEQPFNPHASQNDTKVLSQWSTDDSLAY